MNILDSMKTLICLNVIFDNTLFVKTQLNLFGPYWINFKQFRLCESSIDYPIKFSITILRDTKFSQIFLGNISLKQPFDDHIDMSIMLGKYDSIGLWKEHPLGYIRNTCSILKSEIFGENTWNQFINDFHLPSTNCPLPKGHYASTGFNTSLFRMSKLPKKFFYGKYTSRVSLYDNKNSLIGCTKVSIELNPFT
ncbi:uncharacterized protein LOC126904820 [Daktulosphaira vitifoliae]|uniref:uncharacterized protein LOC126904820 n=1 Tax=Daktulosphaira vitifoliae TaxID=58002 RepID=UPI0021A98092|nr:uncharacterized protein LOC126904820 [Daktulosphaira vitifoliae]